MTKTKLCKCGDDVSQVIETHTYIFYASVSIFKYKHCLELIGLQVQ